MHKHLSIEEREQIQELLWIGRSVRDIARTLGRSHTSISRELKKYRTTVKPRYTPRLAHVQAIAKRSSRGREKRLKNDVVRDYVVTKLKLRWSPEQISGRIKLDLNESISHEAIYQFIYAQVHREGHGSLRPGREDLRLCLRRRRKRRVPKGIRRCQKLTKPAGIRISQRPAIVDQRRRLGDWEGDTVESTGHRPGVNTAVERLSGLVFITKLSDKTARATVAALAKRFKSLPVALKHTLTLDNGPENSSWEAISRETGLDCYFANPYHSWERGTNENTNGLIRDYFQRRLILLPYRKKRSRQLSGCSTTGHANDTVTKPH